MFLQGNLETRGAPRKRFTQDPPHLMPCCRPRQVRRFFPGGRLRCRPAERPTALVPPCQEDVTGLVTGQISTVLTFSFSLLQQFNFSPAQGGTVSQCMRDTVGASCSQTPEPPRAPCTANTAHSPHHSHICSVPFLRPLHFAEKTEDKLRSGH